MKNEILMLRGSGRTTRNLTKYVQVSNYRTVYIVGSDRAQTKLLRALFGVLGGNIQRTVFTDIDTYDSLSRPNSALTAWDHYAVEQWRDRAMLKVNREAERLADGQQLTPRRNP